MSRFAFDAFVRYAHADVAFTRKLVDWLRRAGFRVWFDEEQMPPGARFREIIQKGVSTSQHLIAVLSGEYTRRRWTQREVNLFDLPASRSLSPPRRLPAKAAKRSSNASLINS